eukprot:snap_masked-scaffold_38-processed-gene-1.43-mRNA-1 protein AED:0.25 eAED:0.25 QI:0/-1/0/1/-1/1/1/0/142
MLSNPHFADFSQKVGLASLGASDNDIRSLATCYWFSVEFGLLQESDGVKAWGAGLLSSFGELEWACEGKSEWKPWDPSVAAEVVYPITTYQEMYFVAESLEDAEKKMSDFCENSIVRPFHVEYDLEKHIVQVDRSVKCVEYS